MRRFIAGLVAGLVLASASVGTAAVTYGGWRNMNRDVICRATAISVYCGLHDSVPGDFTYDVYISRCSVSVDQDRGRPNLTTVFRRWQPACK